MSTMTIQLPDAQHERLKRLAKSRGLSVSRGVEEITTHELTEFALETRFRLPAARGDVAMALSLIDRLDADNNVPYSRSRRAHYEREPKLSRRVVAPAQALLHDLRSAEHQASPA